MVICLIIIIHFFNSDLQEFNSNNVPTTPLSIFNGQRFVLQLGFSGIVNKIKILWNYGFSLFKLSRKISSSLKKFSTIYDKQADGITYRTVPEMLQAMGGEEFFQETQVTAENYLIDGLGWNRRMVDELVCSAMKVNYGQNNAIDAFTAFVSLAGVDVGSLWSVVGGNYHIPKKALEASRATLHSAEVSSVTRVENGSNVSYNLEYKDLSVDNTPSVTVKDFDVVIVAHPLNVSKVKFENFPMTIYSDAAKTPYHRTVATFIKGEINGETFGITGNKYPRSFPLDILTTDLENPPVVFNSIGNNIPVTVTDKKAKDFCKPLSEQPTRIWKVFSNRPLTDEEKAKLFRSIDLVVVKDWMAYPQYEPPEQFPSFILDNSGLFYINCIEKAASAMEMSAIGAKNVALLAKDYILSIKKDE